MKPLSNNINIPLIVIVLALLTYYLIALVTILTGFAYIVGPMYPIYISIFVLSLLLILLVFSIRARLSYEMKKIKIM